MSWKQVKYSEIIIHKFFETNSSFHVKQCTAGRSGTREATFIYHVHK